MARASAVRKPTSTQTLAGSSRISDSQVTQLERSYARTQHGLGTGNNVRHEGWDLTPERIVAAYDAAERGNPSLQFDIFDDCVERDLTLGGLVESRADALAGKHVEVQAGAPDADSMRTAEIFRDEVWDRIDWQDLIRHHQYSSNLYGFAASEIDWAYDRELRRIVMRGHWHARPRDFYIATTYFRRVDGADADELLIRTEPSDFTGERLIPGKWVLTKRMDSVPIARAGIGRGSVWWSHIKMVGVGDWLIFIKRFGLPFVLAKIQDWTSTAERSLAETILRRIGDDGGAIVPLNSKIDVEFKDGAQGSRNANGDLHARLASMANTEMAKRWNGAALASESGDGASSYALAKEHGGIRFEFIQADAKRISQSIERQLIEPWQRLNGLPGTAPKIRFHLVRIADPAAYAATADVVINKLRIPLDQSSVLEAVGMRGAETKDSAVLGIAGETEDAPNGQ